MPSENFDSDRFSCEEEEFDYFHGIAARMSKEELAERIAMMSSPNHEQSKAREAIENQYADEYQCWWNFGPDYPPYCYVFGIM